MNIYYTTSAGEGQTQPKTTASLGGFKAGNTVRNDDFDNLFGEISVYTVSQGRDSYVALVLKNDLPQDAENVKIWIEEEADTYCNFQLAVVQMTEQNGAMVMERTRDIYSRPYYAEFNTLDVDNKGELGTMVPDSQFGVWVKRIINKENIEAAANDLYETDPNNPHRVVAKNKDKTETFKVCISWD